MALTKVGLSLGGTNAALTDPNADRILFWDDSASAFTFLTAGAGLDLTGTTLTVADNSITGAKIALGSDAAGDIMYHNGTDYIRLPKGTADQVLTMNDGATAPGWETASAGGSITALSGNAAQRIPFFDSTTTTQLNGDADLKFDGLRILMGSPSTPDALIHMEHVSQTNFLKMRSTATNGKNWTLQSRTDGLFRITQDNSPGFTALEIHGTKGQITKPKQSCGLVRVVSDINNQTGDGNLYQVPFSDSQTGCFDVNDDWNTSANTFYAPVDGKYWFSVNISFKDNLSTASTEIYVCLRTDHSSGITYNIFNQPGRPDGIGTGNPYSVGGSIMVELDAGEYINCAVRVSGDGSNNVQIEGGGSFASYLSWMLVA